MSTPTTSFSNGVWPVRGYMDQPTELEDKNAETMADVSILNNDDLQF